MLSQVGVGKINAKMRAILFDWIVDVHLKYQYKTETLYLTFSLIDRYLEGVQVSRGTLQLVGIICLWIATKYAEEQRHIREHVLICDSAYTKEQMLEMERAILMQLEYRLTVPTQYDFLTRYINVGKLSVETKLIAYYFLEKSMVDIDMLVFKPSLLAAASILLAKKAESLKSGLEYNLWPKTMEFYTRYTQEELTECGGKMIHIVQQHNTDTLQSIHSKYAAARMGNAAGDAYIVKSLVSSVVAERTTGAAVVAEASGDDVRSQLLNIFLRPAPTDHGWSVDAIMGQLTSNVGRGSVIASILSLCDDGELYSTVDDEHYATTGAVVAEASDDVRSQLRHIFLRPAPTNHGWSVDAIMGQLTSNVGRGSVIASILSLCDDGELYSTIDDEHYASTA